MTSANFAHNAEHILLHRQIAVLLPERLPRPIALAVQQSGILQQEKDDFSWLRDKRIQSALLLANEAHNGRARKNGSETRLIHEVWCAHQIYNNPDMRHWLKQNDFDPCLQFVIKNHPRDDGQINN